MAVYGRNPEKAKAFAEKYGIEHHYSEMEQLLDQCDCEVIDICLPNHLHYDACIKSAKTGKHVIVEKPLALTLEQADEMIATCKRIIAS